jgi:regulatory protein
MKTITPDEARSKIQKFCAYQERNHQEVRSKLYSGLHHDDVENLLTAMITEGFLNEERYARAFAGGKFRMKKWGRLKIVNELESKGISRNCIRIGLKEIADDDYLQTLRNLLEHKLSLMNESNVYVLRDKLSKYAIAKGYEPETVWQILKELVPNN